jgi:hypothetical protein
MNRKMLRQMMHSPVRNYVIPGLTSWLIGEPSPKGTMRFFECSRNHQESITPHSHRFDFQCWVLAGQVINRVWRGSLGGGDKYVHTDLVYGGEIGSYERVRIGVANYSFEDSIYQASQWYSMKAHEIHSIQFSAGTEVLFFEGPTILSKSTILEPWVDGDDIPTFKVEPWMFKRSATPWQAQGGPEP